MATLTASMDTTIYRNPNPELLPLGNGQGSHLFAGVTGVNNAYELRRGLLAFDVSGNVPAGAVVETAVLQMTVSLAPPGAGEDRFSVHRALASWGEGASDARDPEGQGAAAAPGDATWLHRFHQDQAWDTPGGVFSPTASSTGLVEGPDTYLFFGEGLAADVQAWVDAPETNFGWFLLGDETSVHNARRFESRNQSDPDNAPTLLISYTIIPEPGTLALIVCGALLLARPGRSRVARAAGPEFPKPERARARID